MRCGTIGFLVLGSLAWGCGDEGAVRLRVELPVDPKLSPFASGTAATLTLWAVSDGEPPEVLTREYDPTAASAGLGELAIRDGVRLSLEVQSANGRLLGFGRVAEPVSVQAGDEVTVSILLRRPFAYVAGASRLFTMDTTVEPGFPYRDGIDDVTFPIAVEATADGAELLVVTGGNLSLVSTSDHLPIGGSVAVGGGVLDVAASPDSRWGVVLRSGGIAIVDLDELRGGAAEARNVDLASASAIALDATTAYVITDGSQVCTGAPSALLAIGLIGAQPVGNLALGSTASDVAVDAESGALAVAQPCRGMVVAIASLDDAAPVDLLPVPAPTTVAASRGRIWAMGSSPGTGSLVLASIGFGGDDMTSVVLPAAEQSARTSDLSEPGQSAEVRITADTIRAIDMAVLPDGQRVALVSYAQYHSDEIDRFLGFSPVIVFPAIDVQTNEYMLIDARGGGVLQRMRTTCNLTTSASDWGPELIDPASWQCGTNPGQDVSGEAFSPTHVAVLYGDR
jgi:hypothetical protein